VGGHLTAVRVSHGPSTVGVTESSFGGPVSTPSSVRVSVVGHYDEDSDRAIDVTDWAPGEERF
jgi:hypothetical protein